MTDDPLSKRLWSAPVPRTHSAEERAVAACNARAQERLTRQAARRRIWARSRPRRMAGLALAGGLALVVALAVFRDAGSSTDGASFSSFAAIAAAQPDGEFQHVEWESQTRHSWPPHYKQGGRNPKVVTGNTQVALWVGDDRRYELGSSSYGRGDPQPAEYLFDRDASLTCFPNSMRLPITIITEDGERMRSGVGEGKTTCSEGNLVGVDHWATADLPTDPPALRVTFEREIRNSPTPDRRLEGGSDTPLGSDMPEEPIGALPVPLSETVEQSRQDLAWELGLAPVSPEMLPVSQQVFSRALTALRDPLASPELRAALFELLADLEGAGLSMGHEDRLGREAALVTYTPPYEHGRDARTWDELYVDPETSQVLEIKTFVESNEGASPEDRVWGSYSELYTEFGAADSLPPEAEQLELALERARARG